MSLIEAQQLSVSGRPAHCFVGGAGPVLLLLHGGWGGAAMHWSRVWEPLARGLRVVAPDLPGLGDFSQPGLPSLPAYAGWLDALLDGLGASDTVVVGNSFGASLAWSLASRFPRRCRAVALVNGVPMPATPAPLLWAGRTTPGRALLRRLVRRVSFRPELLPRAFADPSRAPAELRATLQAVPPTQLETFVDCLIEGDGAGPPAAARLVLWGERDQLPGTSLAAGRKLATRLGAGWESFPLAGHFPQLERPEPFVEAVVRFADRSLG